MDQARRGRAVIVERYGEEQVEILDAADYRCLLGVAAYYSLPPHPAPVTDGTMGPRGVDEHEVFFVKRDRTTMTQDDRGSNQTGT